MPLPAYAIVNVTYLMFTSSYRSRGVLQILCWVCGFTAGFWSWQGNGTSWRTSLSTHSRVRAIPHPAPVSSALRASGTMRTTGSTCRTAALAVRSVREDFRVLKEIKFRIKLHSSKLLTINIVLVTPHLNLVKLFILAFCLSGDDI